jgi:hypothetical protein
MRRLARQMTAARRTIRAKDRGDRGGKGLGARISGTVLPAQLLDCRIAVPSDEKTDQVPNRNRSDYQHRK